MAGKLTSREHLVKTAWTRMAREIGKRYMALAPTEAGRRAAISANPQVIPLVSRANKAVLEGKINPFSRRQISTISGGKTQGAQSKGAAIFVRRGWFF